MTAQTTLQLNPNKLLHSKWTATIPSDKEKHFIVTKVIAPALSATQIETIELEAIYSGRSVTLPWRALTDSRQWLQGWQ